MNAIRVLVTRPQLQAQNLINRLRDLHFHTIACPTIEIANAYDDKSLMACISKLDHFNKAIFLSANAVEKVFAYIAKEKGEASNYSLFCSTKTVFAIGVSTAQKLKEKGIVAQTPSILSSNSEGLLSLSALKYIKDEKIIIFCGENPRSLLKKQLEKRGAQVMVVPTYRRQLPQVDILPLLTDWRRNGLDIIIVASQESLKNLVGLIGPEKRAWLLNQQLLVISERVAHFAKVLGFIKKPVVAQSASDDGIISALLHLWKPSTSED